MSKKQESINDDCMYEYDNGYYEETWPTGFWMSFFLLTLGAILFIILWPLFLIGIIYFYISERRWDAKMEREAEEERNTAKRREYYDNIEKETKKKAKKSRKNKSKRGKK